MEQDCSLVTQLNYCEIREYIDEQIEHFLINRESWVLMRFRRLPETPDRDSIDELNGWISTFLSRRDLRDLLARFGDKNSSGEPNLLY